ncbi:hypothetical protein [Leucobacter manosquensis]|uniref:Uncharacterized protein n=1 Tax=Leucobacter manosquensis TaxID=2810611 RepID=A0ABS5M1B1_9MICO|nr:hypothetical protein [Leucobacter manosquensis]MBS3180968.1 hypothetical protein [Leucobacter manosquensis]
MNSQAPESATQENSTWFDELLADLSARSEATLAELQDQNPADIDVATRVPWLSRQVLDWLYEIRASLNAESRAAVEAWKESERRQMRRFRELVERAEQRFQASLPPNWHGEGLDFPAVEELEQLQLFEGLPLAWVPPSQVLRRLLRVSSFAERRKVIEEESTVILTSCESTLMQVHDPRLTEWKATALEAVTVMQAGSFRAGQALATVALDSAVTEFVTNGYQHAVAQTVKGKATPPGTLATSLPAWDDVDHPRALLVFYGLWGAHKRYWKKRGDDVPDIYSRHATVHTMSDRQYTNANALIAVMHLIGLLCMLDEMMTEQRTKLTSANRS